MQGTVHCEFIAPVAAKSITVVLEGYEKVEWHERRDRSENIPNSDPPQSRTIPRYIRKRAKKTFFKEKIPVSARKGDCGWLRSARPVRARVLMITPCVCLLFVVCRCI